MGTQILIQVGIGSDTLLVLVARFAPSRPKVRYILLETHTRQIPSDLAVEGVGRVGGRHSGQMDVTCVTVVVVVQ